MSTGLQQWKYMLAVLILSSCLLVESKVFERCELAKILRQRHRLNLSEVAQWVCIAQHSSGFNTAAQAFSPSGGSHGLFQISDVYWCSPPGQGAGCNIPCHKLRDDNLSDDLTCIKKIYSEHQRISGDGYTAWNAYQQFCKNNANSYIQDCFPGEQVGYSHSKVNKGYSYQGQFAGNAIADYAPKKSGKVYGRCELARELYQKHNMPMQQIPTWVCIAEHESRFNTAAVGRLNADGSADHGLFQISDLYWCSHDRFSGGKACGLSCNKLLDDDITDDVRCIKRIHNEHTAISGDGFNAWTVYKPHCQNQRYEHIANCFKNTQHKHQQQYTTAVSSTTNQVYSTNKFGLSSNNPFLQNVISSSISKTHYATSTHNAIHKTSQPSRGVSHKGKVYTRCSLAQELYFKHNFPMQDISTWVCIAEHESQFNTAAIGRLNTDGSADHGLFQISDRYWCDHSAYGGKACNLPCDKLLDDDLRDDVACIKTIHEEHTRLSGDGFNAWTVYRPHCQSQNIHHISECFDDETLHSVEKYQPAPSYNVEVSKGKIYSKCELAQELYHKHHMPMEQISKWVCIAQHESSFNTAAVGRLNADGSADHGLFQISDLYWCSHDQYGGKACNIPCHKLLDSDITDDVRCIKIIHEEHTRISGDGFNAWTVYQPHCRNTGMDHIKQCFTDKELKDVPNKTGSSSSNALIPGGSKTVGKGKIYKKCELAQELYRKHHMPMEQIPKWVCIAQHESSYNTAAVGRLNTDGSADHGLFQISDLYWCTHDQYGGKACNIPCDKLLDSDITDDVRCIKIIHEEHTRISGDGFNAWTVYKPHCRNIAINHVQECFTDKELKDVKTGSSNALVPQTSYNTKPVPKGKIYKKCELAQELYHKHHMPMEQIPKWVCIAQHESSYNTAAVGRLNADGSADHGLFQISDLYWCSHDQYGGKACNIPCDKLLDSDITDDVRCIKIIHEEHTRISGDGFNAWTVYKPHCRNIAINHVQECFTDKELKEVKTGGSNALIPQTSYNTKPVPKGKIYKKCELAQELYHKHHMPMEQIPKWVCIAQHESSYNTAAVGRLNTDGSADHGLFQISDLYWCTHDQYGGKACNIPCDKLLDSDITDDVRCIKIIHEEHTRISGDGFNAWTVYKPHCRNIALNHVKECFTEKELQQANDFSTSVSTNSVQPQYSPATKNVGKGKIYKKCELAQELLSKHKMPMEQIPTWVCIAQHESSFNTAAVGRLNADGSADHGLFQISDLYWCSHDPYGGKACNIPCDKLLDSDITDDVRCIKIIHEEHTRISGDGFNAWTVYKPHCRNRKMDEIRSCFSPNQIEEHEKSEKYTNKATYTQTYQQQPVKNSFSHNPFLSGGLKPQSSETVQKISYNEKPNYAHNPFLQNLQVASGSQVHKTSTQFLASVSNTFQPETTSKPNYKDNPFLNGAFSSSSNKNVITQTSDKDSYKANPFLSNLKLTTTTKPASTQSTGVYKTEVTKHYLNSNEFRTTTTAKPRTTTVAKPITTTTKKPTTSWTTTTKKPTTSWTTTKSPKTTTTWSWQNQKYQNPITTTTTKKPLSTTKATTSWNWQSQKSTTTTPKASTTRSWQNPSTTSRTTTTTKSPKLTTTWSWQNQKYQNPTTSTTTTKKPLTINSTTTWNWQNPSTTSRTTTTKSPKTTSTWSWQNQKYPNATTTVAPRTSTTWNWQNQKYQNPTTTKSPKASTSWNWKNQQYLSLTTTKAPKTTRSWNQKYINNSTLGVTSTTTTKKPERTTWNWRNEQKSTTTKPSTTTVDWKKWDKTTTTKKPSTIATTTTTSKTTTKSTTSKTTTKPIRLESYKTSTTIRPYYNDNLKTTTLRPRTTTTTTTSIPKTLTTKSSKINDYKKDPFSHPFFAKVNQEIEQLRKHVSTTKLPTFAASKLQSFPQSQLYQDFKNNTLNKTKTVVAYSFENSKFTTTKRPR